MSSNSYYRVEFPNGTTKYYNAIATAASEMTNGSKLVLQVSVNFNNTTPIMLARRAVNNITIDLNGYFLKNQGAGEFFHIAGHEVTIMSSRAGGKIIADSTASGSLALKLLGETVSWRPKLTISNNVRIESNGDSAIIN